MKRKILAIDDSRTVLNMLELYLKDEYELFCGTSGDQAFQILQKQDIDIILLDIMMPVMNGMMVLKRLREKPQWRDIPVVFLTGNAHRATVIESFTSGSQGYLLKPISKEALVERIEETWKKQEKRKAETQNCVEEERQKEDERRREEEEQRAKELMLAVQREKEEEREEEQEQEDSTPEVEDDLHVVQDGGEQIHPVELDPEESLFSSMEGAEDFLQNFITSDLDTTS